MAAVVLLVVGRLQVRKWHRGFGAGEVARVRRKVCITDLVRRSKVIEERQRTLGAIFHVQRA